jgi:hypothetical protein
MGFAFLIVFGVVLLLQFIGTLLHRWDTFCHIIARTEVRTSDDTVEGKLRAVEKLQSVGRDADDEFDIPPPDYDKEDMEEPEADYPSDDDDNTSERDSAYGPDDSSYSHSGKDNASDTSSGLPYKPAYDRTRALPPINEGAHFGPRMPPRSSAYPPPGGARYQPNYPPYGGHPGVRRANYTDLPPPTGHRYARQHQRLGQVRVSGLSLHRNFQRRYNHLVKNVQDEASRGMDGQHGHGPSTAVDMAPRPRHRKPNFNDIYKTIRQRSGVIAQPPSNNRFAPMPPPHGGYYSNTRF